jgi:membrane protease YdiL (CAAX protease family)
LNKWLKGPKIYPILLWGSAVCFGLWHYHNFDFNQANILTIMVSLLPFVINGLILSYVSLRLGLIWSIGLHILNNFWPLVLWL